MATVGMVVGVAALRSGQPAVRHFVKRRAGQPRIELDPAAQFKPVRHMVGVAQQLGLASPLICYLFNS